MNPAVRTEIRSPEDILEGVFGRTITSGEVNEDGLHLSLSDGRVIIIVGTFVLSVCTLSHESSVH